MSQFERRQTHCAACKDSFSYQYRITHETGGNLIIHTTCPFCKTKLKIDLNPYTRRTLVSYKGLNGSTGDAADTITLELPHELPSIVEA